MHNDLLSTREAAVILGMTQETVSRLVKKGKLEGQKLGGFFVVTRTSVEVYALAITGKSKNDPTRKVRGTRQFSDEEGRQALPPA
jgi:excisionase family DNA binding protein